MIVSLLQPDPSRTALWHERARLLAEIERLEHRIQVEIGQTGLTAAQLKDFVRLEKQGLLNLPKK